MYKRLSGGEAIEKAAEAKRFGVNEKTIQRDIETIRNFLAEVQGEGEACELLYSRSKKGYVLVSKSENYLTGADILAIAKVLLESRAFCREELDALIDKLKLQALPEDKKRVQNIIANEQFHYMPVQHEEFLIDKIWELSQAMKEQRLVELEYKRENKEKPFIRVVEPQGIIFSEYYFYLIACIHNACYDFPAIYRVDRIQNFAILNEGFSIAYCDRFKEGEFRQRVQFMHSGPLLRITFRYWGKSLEAVMDRLPTAKIIREEGQSTLLEAEVFGQGIKMWLLSQGEYIEVIEPKKFREEMKKTAGELANLYGCD